MFRMLKLFAWCLLSIALLAALDQILLRVPLELPGVREAQTFYVDFRSRLVGLATGQKAAYKQQPSIEQLIETKGNPATKSKPAAQRYLYVDKDGALQFADSLEQVPRRYRDSAQRLAE